jgi:hypothetical protein
MIFTLFSDGYLMESATDGSNDLEPNFENFIESDGMILIDIYVGF